MQTRKGSKQVRSHKKLQSFPSEPGSCASGVADENSNSVQLRSRNSTRRFGTPINSLLAAEMARETESKRRAPGVIARLMGLDGLPLPLPKQQHKDSSENHLKRTAQVGKTRSSATLYDSGSSRRSSKDHVEYKDVFEVSEIPKVENSRYSSQRSADLKIADDEMAFSDKKFMDAKRLATCQDLLSSKDSHDALEILDSESDLLHKYFKRPDSLFKKHLDEPIAVPIRIVILKPNLGKALSATKTGSSPHSSHAFQSHCRKHAEFPDVTFRGMEMNQKRSLRSTPKHSRKKSSDYRKVAKEITSQIKDNLDNGSMVFSSSRLRGYTWDDSPCDFSEIESLEESDVSTATLGNPFDKSNNHRPSSHCSESSVSREAKKRLSERWKMSHKSQQGQSICRSSTLAEMLAVPDKEIKAANVDSGESFHDKLASNGKPSGRVEPFGISSRDGWKDGFIGSLPRSKSLPASSTAFGSHRTILRHEALRDDRYLTPLKWERKKQVKSLDQRQCMNTKSSKSDHKKSWSSHSSNIEDDESSSPDIRTIQNKMKINLEEDLSKQEVLTAESIAETLRDTSAVTVDAVDVANENAAGLSESSDKVLLPELSSCVLTKADTNAVDKNNLMQQELSVGSSGRNSVSFQPPGPRLESSYSKVANQPSPISVIKSSFTDDLSPCSECFESLSVDIQGLRMQLQLLKSESGDNVEGSPLVSNDEDGGEASTGILEDKGLHNFEDSWEYYYVIDVLTESGIDISQPEETLLEVWHSPECPISPSVFDELEKRYSDWTICSRSERRFLFDRINSATVNVHEQFIGGSSTQPWVSPRATSLSFELTETGLQDCLYSILGSQVKSKGTTLDKVLVDSPLQWFNLRDYSDATAREVEKMLMDSHLQWFNLRDDIDAIAREIENLLLDDLVAEIAST